MYYLCEPSISRVAIFLSRQLVRKIKEEKQTTSSNYVEVFAEYALSSKQEWGCAGIYDIVDAIVFNDVCAPFMSVLRATQAHRKLNVLA